MIIPVNLKENSYEIRVERGILKKAGEYLNLNRRVLIVTDTGVPKAYAERVAAECKTPVVIAVEEGEASKSLATYEMLLKVMLENHFTRKDCVVAVGGGVVGDLSGFVAASYMRGVDFYNIPTTLLSQIDSSIGGKTAVNFCGIKNIVGAFHQPRAVLIDPDVLSTLPDRQIANGLAEAIKMALTFNESLFRLFEEKDTLENIDTVITESLKIKRDVVEQDEKESGLRKVLNFGHTVGHGIESEEALHGLYHGECVALGMLPMCAEPVRERLLTVLAKVGLPTEAVFDKDKAFEAMLHDKKFAANTVTVITVDTVGSFRMREVDRDTLYRMLSSLNKH